MTPAATARQNDWQPGDILIGAPIIRDGREVERGVRIRLTAIGEENTLGVDIDPDGTAGNESMWFFDAREWHKEPRP